MRLGASIVVIDDNIRLFGLATHRHFDELTDTLGGVVVGQYQGQKSLGLNLLLWIGVIAALVFVEIDDVLSVIIQRYKFLFDAFSYKGQNCPPGKN